MNSHDTRFLWHFLDSVTHISLLEFNILSTQYAGLRVSRIGGHLKSFAGDQVVKTYAGGSERVRERVAHSRGGDKTAEGEQWAFEVVRTGPLP